MSNKITYSDKVGLVAPGVRANQWQDIDANEIKDKHNLNDDRITNIEDNQTIGYLAYSTYAELPVSGTLNYSYKVTNDSTSSLNGFYHWNSASYVKDDELNQDIVDQINDVDDRTLKGNFVPTESEISARIRELLVIGYVENSVYSTRAIEFEPSLSNYIRMFIYRDSVLIGNVTINDTTDYYNLIYEFDIDSGEPETVYIAFNTDVDYTATSLTDRDFSSKAFDISFNPQVEMYLNDTLRSDVDLLQGKFPKEVFLNNEDADLRVSELYIPNASSYGSMYVGAISVTSTLMRLFIYDSSNTLIAIGSFTDVDTYVYDKPFQLTKYQGDEVFGYAILTYYEDTDYLKSGVTYAIDNTKADTLNSNPQLKEYFEKDEQIVLCGDSMFGIIDAKNALQTLISDATETFVYNCGFGGCRMAWRTVDGSDDYDKFTFPDVADTLLSGDFTAMEAANASIGGDFNTRIAALREVDLTKNTTIFVNYVNNDLTGATVLGDKWEDGDVLGDFVKNTFFGAMNYGILKILGTFPNTNFVFFTEAWRYKNDKDGVSVPPYLFINSNLDTSYDFRDESILNWLRLGISYWDFLNLGGRNKGNIDYMTIDGSHFSYEGYKVFSEKISALYIGKK